MVFLFSLAFSFTALAGNVYRWTKPDLNSRSVCIVVDEETGGRKTNVLVEDAFCPKLETVFEWSKPEFGFNSRCEEMDKQSDGAEFRREAPPSRCIKPLTVHLWLKPEGFKKIACLEVDTETRGRIFRLPAANRLCPLIMDMNAAFPKAEPYVAEDMPAVNKEKRVKTTLGREFESNPLFWEELLPEKR